MLTNIFSNNRPSLWSELCGNEDLKQQFTEMLRLQCVPPAILLTGESGIGKTTVAQLIARRVRCERSRADELEPCLKCSGCDIDLRPEAMFKGPGVYARNCARLTRAELIRDLDNARYHYAWPLVFYLDEAQRASEPLLEILYTFIEDPCPNSIVILSLIDPDLDAPELDDAMMRRLFHFHVEPPNQKQLIPRLREMWRRIKGSAVEDDLLQHIVELHGAVPGKCENALSQYLFRNVSSLTAAEQHRLL